MNHSAAQGILCFEFFNATLNYPIKPHAFLINILAEFCNFVGLFLPHFVGVLALPGIRIILESY